MRVFSSTRLGLVVPALAVVAAATLGCGAVSTTDAGAREEINTAVAPAPVSQAGSAVAPADTPSPSQKPIARVDRDQFIATGSSAVVGPADDGDVDGDGRLDQVALIEPGILRIVYSGGGSQDVPFSADLYPSPTLLGVVDADWDGHAEVFVRAFSGASTEFASLFRYTEGQLRLVTINGSQAGLGYGGSVTHHDFWTCRPPRTPIVTWTATSEDGRTLHGTETRYEFRGAELVATSSHPRSGLASEQSGCGSLSV